MPPLKDMLPHAQSYLRGLTLDEGLPEPMRYWQWLPARWDFYSENEAFLVSSVLGWTVLVTQTVFDGAEVSRSSRRLILADRSIDRHCPFFYSEVSITADDMCDAK